MEMSIGAKSCCPSMLTFDPAMIKPNSNGGLLDVHHPGIYSVHSGPLSLAVPPWVGTMSTGDGFGHLWE